MKKIVFLLLISLLSLSVVSIDFRMFSIYTDNCDYNVCGSKSPWSGLIYNGAIYNQQFNLESTNDLDFYRTQLKNKELNYISDLYWERINYNNYQTTPTYLGGLDELIDEKYDFRIDNIKKNVLMNADSDDLISGFNKNTYPQFFDSLGRLNIAKDPLEDELLKIIESNYERIENNKKNLNFDPTYLFEEILLLETAINYDVAYGLSADYFQLVELNISKISFLKADKVFFKLLHDIETVKNNINSQQYKLVTYEKIDELVNDFSMDRDELISKNNNYLQEMEVMIGDYNKLLLKINLFNYDNSSYNDQFNSKINEWVDDFNNYLDSLDLSKYNYVPPVLTENEIEEIEEELSEELDEVVFKPTGIVDDPEDDPVDEPVADPEYDPVDEPVADPEDDPVDEPVADPEDDPVNEPVADPEYDPVDEPVADPEDDPVDEPVADPEDDPVNEPVADPEDDPVDEPITDPDDDPVDLQDGENQTFVPLGGEDDDDEGLEAFVEDNFGGLIDRIPLQTQKSRFNAFLILVAFLIYMVLFRK